MMFNDYTYLYVEDDPLSREALAIIFKRMMKVDRFYILSDSHNFMNQVRQLPHIPNVILLDIHIEPLSGYEMLALLRQDPAYQSAKIIALTASVMTDEVDMLKQRGFDGLIGKPLEVTSFPKLIQQLLDEGSVWHVTI